MPSAVGKACRDEGLVVSAEEDVSGEDEGEEGGGMRMKWDGCKGSMLCTYRIVMVCVEPEAPRAFQRV